MITKQSEEVGEMVKWGRCFPGMQQSWFDAWIGYQAPVGISLNTEQEKAWAMLGVAPRKKTTKSKIKMGRQKENKEMKGLPISKYLFQEDLMSIFLEF